MSASLDITRPPTPISSWPLTRLIADTEMEAIYRDLWPPIMRRLTDAPNSTIKTVIDIVAHWLRIGAGHDRPFGNSHPQQSVEAAHGVGARLLRDLEPLASTEPGLAHALAHVAEMNSLEVHRQPPSDLSPFFTAVDFTDYEPEIQRLEIGIAAVVDQWGQDTPQAVMQRLGALKPSLALAGLAWPDRIEIACRQLAGKADYPTEWIDAALEYRLFPSAGPFLDVLLQRDGRLPAPVLDQCLASPDARGRALPAVFQTGTDDDQLATAIRRLGDSDARILDFLVAQGLPLERKRAVLVSASPEVRGAFALSLFIMSRNEQPWPPVEIAAEWKSAVPYLDIRSGDAVRVRHVKQLLDFLVSTSPDVVEAFAESALRKIQAGQEPAPKPLTEVMFRLPSTFKTAALMDPANHSFRLLLASWLIGNDAAWTGDMLQAGALTAEGVLATRSGFEHNELSIPQLAELLVPYGVDPARIAEHAQFGMYSGQHSDHYRQLLDEFEKYATSDVEEVALVGRAGVRYYTNQHNEASSAEARERVRGDTD